MAKRDNHYEAAFEAYLRDRQVPYVAVDEAKRSLLNDDSLKSLDFIVSPAAGPSWLIDVKGRLFPGADGKQYWKNWTTSDDLRSMTQWQRLFGEQFCALFVFAYNVVGDRAPLAPQHLYEFRGGLYGFIAMRVVDYAYHARPISSAWDTLAMPTEQFRHLAVPMHLLLEPPTRLSAAV